MKKLSIIVSCIIALAVTLCSCGNKTGAPETSQAENIDGGSTIVNPVSEITAEDTAKELGLKKVELNGITKILKIDGNNAIYEIIAEENGKEYNIRIAKADETQSSDISGVYLNGKINSAIYDSDGINAPSVSVDGDSDCTKAYGEWNGMFFSVSTENKLSLDEMQKTAVNFAKEIISAENIIK